MLRSDIITEDLFGGLSDSDDSDGEGGSDEMLLASTRPPSDLIPELGLSGSINGDGEEEEEEQGSGGQKSRSFESQKNDKTQQTSRDYSVKNRVVKRETCDFTETTVGGEYSNQISSGDSSSSFSYSSDSKQRKRKYSEKIKSEVFDRASDQTDEPVDDFILLTKSIENISKQNKPVKRKTQKEKAFPMESASLVSCPSSSTPLQNVVHLCKDSDTQTEVPRKLSSKEKAEELKQMEQLVLIGNFSKEQLDRYEVYKRSTFNKTAIKKIIEKNTGAPAGDQLVISIRSLAKMLVGDLVEEATELREARGETDKPIQPHHIKAVFNSLVCQGKLWPPYGSRP